MYHFPNDPVLARLLIAANRTPGSKIVVHDAYGYEKTYLHLLGDIIHMRSVLTQRLAPSPVAPNWLLKNDSRYVGILSKSAYEFLVSFFAIRSIGGTPILLSSGILPEEAHYLLSKADSRCICASRGCLGKVAEIAAYMNAQSTTEFLTMQTSCDAEAIRSIDSIRIHDTTQLATDGPGVVLFTSGTTGRPKMVVLPRRCFAYPELAPLGSATINYRPIHWIGGARCLLEAIVTGVELFTLEEKSISASILEMFQNHKITHMSFSPMTLRRLKSELIARMEEEPETNYASWFSGLSKIKCGGSMVESSAIEFWTTLTGRPIEIFYSATELGGPSIKGIPIMPNAIGTPLADVKVKLSQGDRGEILIKSPRMFTHYLGDEEITKQSFDDEGYYRTGDLAELKDGQFVFGGRANADFIIYRFSKIPALLVENSLLDLPYISQACVLGIPHTVAKELCAAIIRLHQDANTVLDQITFDQIRSDLAKTLPAYMLPTLLRILREDEALPLTSIGKPIKREIRTVFFKTTDWWSIENPPLDVEYWNNKAVASIGEKDLRRPWDWCAQQIAD
ncbi:Uncharacterized protein BP5553_06392 [Venustampulla echinocandica]|uniref:Acetyl-CoA synthetase-like protein n=1 Tax=Venustampulla echinocandica TaxID=2656787 RepID=A0A370TJS3_9HELO|nr:Uncharacterized protein BP5553_06392 [Venustampulla echinocandica]RDL35780.1 Uncharacterized protein BP5553_06392 [Venustampulla echinocandica]